MPMPKVDLYAAIRRDSRAGMSGRTLAQKYKVSRHTVQAALTSAWPQPRKPMPRRASKLDSFKPVIDEILRADLDAPRKQRHTVKRIYDRLIDEHGMHSVSYPVVRAYVTDRKPQIRVEAGRGPVNVFVPQTHLPGAEALCGFPHRASYAACGNMRRRTRRGEPLADFCAGCTAYSRGASRSESFEEGQEGVGWPVSAWACSRRCGLGDGLLFEVEVDVEVDAVGRADILVSQPQGDGGRVDAVPEQVHGAACGV
jgi:transposase